MTEAVYKTFAVLFLTKNIFGGKIQIQYRQCRAHQGVSVMKNRSGGEDRRREPRHFYVSTIRFSPHPVPSHEERDGYTLNMSRDGLCLAMTKPLEVGQEIVITNCLISALRRTYRVQWIEQSEKSYASTYMAGLISSGN
jgi:hypothetical protein